MHKTEQNILYLFKKQPNKAFSTFDIAKAVQAQDIIDIEKVFQDRHSDKEKIKLAKRKKAQIHRKILYHLNRLVKSGVLKVAKQGTKGEKYFDLALKQGEELIVDKYAKHSITVAKPYIPAMPIEGFEHMSIVSKFEEPTWIDRLNSIMFESVASNSTKLYSDIKNSFDLVNDAICINDAHLLLKEDFGTIIDNISKLDLEARSYGRKISLCFDLEQLNVSHLDFFDKLCSKGLEFTNVVFNTDASTMQSKGSLFEKLIGFFYSSRREIFVKNSGIVNSPMFAGSAGVYKFHESEYNNYLQEFKENLVCASCAQSCLNVDVKKFYDAFGFNIDNFNKFIVNCAESLLSANALQRRRSVDYFKYLSNLNPEFNRQTFMFSRNYLRFYNYEFLENEFDQDFIIDLFGRLHVLINDFCMSEETIYKSCGMPTRFRVALSNFSGFAYGSKNEEEIIEIKSLEDFYSDEIKPKIHKHERLFESFGGGSMLRFSRKGNVIFSDVLREITTLLNSYRIGFFVYDFSKSKAVDMRLEEFI